MKTMKIILVLVIAAGVALAQAPAKKNGTKKPGSAAATAPAHKAAKAAAPKPAAQTSPMKPKAPKKAAVQPAAAPAPAPAQAAVGKNRRDPFVNPVVARGPGPGPCAGGKRCLAIDQLVVRGVVKGPRGWIAIVENPAKKTYFLNDNDELYDGSVVRITGDSVVFKQNTLDAMGRTSTREVEKKLSAGPA